MKWFTHTFNVKIFKNNFIFYLFTIEIGWYFKLNLKLKLN